LKNDRKNPTGFQSRDAGRFISNQDLRTRNRNDYYEPLKMIKMKMLHTNLHEIESASELEQLISDHENVMVCCGRMGPMCIPVYEIMEELEEERTDVKFAVMAFDSPEAGIIRNDPACRGFMGLPFTMYYKGGRVAKATSSIQNMNQVTSILDAHFSTSNVEKA
jgi:thioredoxin 1